MPRDPAPLCYGKKKKKRISLTWIFHARPQQRVCQWYLDIALFVLHSLRAEPCNTSQPSPCTDFLGVPGTKEALLKPTRRRCPPRGSSPWLLLPTTHPIQPRAREPTRVLFAPWNLGNIGLKLCLPRAVLSLC